MKDAKKRDKSDRTNDAAEEMKRAQKAQESGKEERGCGGEARPSRARVLACRIMHALPVIDGVKGECFKVRLVAFALISKANVRSL